MRLLQLIVVALSGAVVTNSLHVPVERRSDSSDPSGTLKRSIPLGSGLEKRKGGGGRGGGGSSSSGSSSGSRGGSSSSGSSPNSGGRTVSGTGTRPAYGGGNYYGGGGAVPYTAGTRTPKGLLALGLLPIAGLGFLGAAWIATYPYGAYYYHYNNPWRYYNASSSQNETAPVTCLCGRYNTCGCDDNDDPQYIRSIINDGNPANFDSNIVRVADANGTGPKTIYIKGDLDNGTTAAGASSAAFHTVSAPKGLAVWYTIAFLFIGTIFSTL